MSAEPEAGVVRAVETMTARFERGDLNGVLAAYHDGAVVAFEPGRTSSGLPALRAGFEGFMTLRPRFSYRGHDVMIAGDLALHIAPWSMAGTAPDGAAIIEAGLSVAVLKQGEDGTWRIALDNPFGDRLLGPG